MLVFLGSCTSNDELDRTQSYTVSDLIEVASKYGVKFQPCSDAQSMKLSKADVDSFEVEIQAISRLKGKYPLVKTGRNEVKMQQRINSNRLKTRATAETVDSDSYPFPTYSKGFYTCDCTLYWMLVFADNGELIQFNANASISVWNMDSLPGSVDGYTCNYVPWLNAVECRGSVLCPYYRQHMTLGYITISVYAIVYVGRTEDSYINWMF